MLHATSSYHFSVILPNNRLGLVMHFPLSLSGCSKHPTPDVSLMETILRSQLEIFTYVIANASFLQLWWIHIPPVISTHKTPDLSLALIPIWCNRNHSSKLNVGIHAYFFKIHDINCILRHFMRQNQTLSNTSLQYFTIHMVWLLYRVHSS